MTTISRLVCSLSTRQAIAKFFSASLMLVISFHLLLQFVQHDNRITPESFMDTIASGAPGPIERYLNLQSDGMRPPHAPEDRLFLRRVRQLDRVTPANSTTKPKCVVVSCASPGYGLVDASFKSNVAHECDRVHFATTTYNRADGSKVASTWCRVPLLQRYLPHYFAGRYERVLYVDSDLRYRDPEIMRSDCSMNASVLVSTKPVGGIQEMQMNWLLVCDTKDRRLEQLFRRWDRMWRDVHMQDQTVFNEAWKCGDLNGGIKCVNSAFDNAILVFHCGGYLTRFLRGACMRKHF